MENRDVDLEGSEFSDLERFLDFVLDNRLGRGIDCLVCPLGDDRFLDDITP